MGGFTSAPSALGLEPAITQNTITIHGIRATATRPFLGHTVQDLECSVWISKAGRKVVVRVASKDSETSFVHRFGVELGEEDVRSFKDAKRTGREHRMIAAKLLNTPTASGEMAYQVHSKGLHMGVVVFFDAGAAANRTWRFLYQQTELDATLLEFGLPPTDAQRVYDWISVPPREGSRPGTWFIWNTHGLSIREHSSGVGAGAGAGADAGAGAGAGAGTSAGSASVRRALVTEMALGGVLGRGFLEDPVIRAQIKDLSERGALGEVSEEEEDD